MNVLFRFYFIFIKFHFSKMKLVSTFFSIALFVLLLICCIAIFRRFVQRRINKSKSTHTSTFRPQVYIYYMLHNLKCFVIH